MLCRVPWGRIERDPHAYIEPDMFPDGAVFRDPYRMPHKLLAPLWDEIVRRHRLPANNADPWRFSHVWLAENLTPAKYGEDPEPIAPRTGRAGKRERKRVANARREQEAAAWAGETPGTRSTGQAGARASSKKTKSPKRNVGPRGSSSKKGEKRKRKNSKGGGSRRRRRRRGGVNPEETSESEEEDFFENEDDGSTGPAETSDEEEEIPESSRKLAGTSRVKPRPINPPTSLGALLSIPPDETTVENARNQPPSWALSRRSFLPYLWGLAREEEYRAVVAAWRHMVRCGPTSWRMPLTDLGAQLHRSATIPIYNDEVTDWATWSFETTNVPERIHTSPRRTRWNKLLDWLSDMCPTPNTGAGDIQKFLLVAGMVIRDIHIVNSIEDDEEVPQGGADYLRHSQSSFADLTNKVYPLLQRAHRPSDMPPELPNRTHTRSSSADEVQNLIDEPMNVDTSTRSLHSHSSESALGMLVDVAARQIPIPKPTLPEPPRFLPSAKQAATGGPSAGPSATPDQNSGDTRAPADQRDGGSAVVATAVLGVTLPPGPHVTDGPQADHGQSGPGPQTAGQPADVGTGASVTGKDSPPVRAGMAEAPGSSLATTPIEPLPPQPGPTTAAQKNKRGGRTNVTVPNNEVPPPDLKGKGKAVDIAPVNEPAQLPLPQVPLRVSKRVRKQPP